MRWRTHKDRLSLSSVGAVGSRDDRDKLNRGIEQGTNMTKSVSATRGTKMTVKDASRIYRTTAVKGDGSVPAGSFAARAMRTAMHAAAQDGKLGKSKAK